QARMNRSGGFGEEGPHFDGADAATSAHGARARPSAGRTSARRGPVTIEGELVAKSTGSSSYAIGDRVFHQKFGYGEVVVVDGNKLTIQFDKAGEKRVVDSFVAKA